MNTPLSLEESKRLVAKAAQDFVRECRAREHPLSPFADSIVALCEKHASYRTIADILRAAGVTVSHHSVARFCRGHLAAKPRKKSAPRKGAETRKTSRQPERAPGIKTTPQTPQVDIHKVIAQRREEERDSMSPRERGPRIADPRNV
jgi:hypothetical protein